MYPSVRNGVASFAKFQEGQHVILDAKEDTVLDHEPAHAVEVLVPELEAVVLIAVLSKTGKAGQIAVGEGMETTDWRVSGLKIDSLFMVFECLSHFDRGCLVIGTGERNGFQLLAFVGEAVDFVLEIVELEDAVLFDQNTTCGPLILERVADLIGRWR